tara:strand:+ start:217731 stop:218480 length:750 start_codon:yes stop_codon:yes gene_type:complete
MISKEQSQKKVPDLADYIHALIEHLTTQKQQGEACLTKEDYVGAQEKFDNALNHYTVRTKTLNQLTSRIYIPQLDRINEHQATLKKHNDISTELMDLLNDITHKREQNAPQAEQQAKEIKRLAAIQLAETHKIELEEKLIQITQNIHDLHSTSTRTDKGNTISEESLVNPAQSALNMSILAGFITALGITAVAIAFATLNLAGLAMPGVALAGFGLVTTAIGCSIFCSSAKNVDEYTDNLCSPFHASTA